MKNKVEDFKKDVLHEINMLKQHATIEEKQRLQFSKFDYKEKYLCIYGMLAGTCENLRAKELMELSCIRVMDLGIQGVNALKGLEVSDDNFIVNGKNKGQTWKKVEPESNRNYSYLSALEGYICTKNANNEQIINYIKGFSNELVL